MVLACFSIAPAYFSLKILLNVSSICFLLFLSTLATCCLPVLSVYWYSMIFVPLTTLPFTPNSFSRSFSPVTASAIASTACITGFPIAAPVSPKVFNKPLVGSKP